MTLEGGETRDVVVGGGGERSETRPPSEDAAALSVTTTAAISSSPGMAGASLTPTTTTVSRAVRRSVVVSERRRLVDDDESLRRRRDGTPVGFIRNEAALRSTVAEVAKRLGTTSLPSLLIVGAGDAADVFTALCLTYHQADPSTGRKERVEGGGAPTTSSSCPRYGDHINDERILSRSDGSTLVQFLYWARGPVSVSGAPSEGGALFFGTMPIAVREPGRAVVLAGRGILDMIMYDTAPLVVASEVRDMLASLRRIGVGNRNRRQSSSSASSPSTPPPPFFFLLPRFVVERPPHVRCVNASRQLELRRALLQGIVLLDNTIAPPTTAADVAAKNVSNIDSLGGGRGGGVDDPPTSSTTSSSLEPARLLRPPTAAAAASIALIDPFPDTRRWPHARFDWRGLGFIRAQDAEAFAGLVLRRLLRLLDVKSGEALPPERIAASFNDDADAPEDGAPRSQWATPLRSCNCARYHPHWCADDERRRTTIGTQLWNRSHRRRRRPRAQTTRSGEEQQQLDGGAGTSDATAVADEENDTAASPDIRSPRRIEPLNLVLEGDVVEGRLWGELQQQRTQDLATNMSNFWNRSESCAADINNCSSLRDRGSPCGPVPRSFDYGHEWIIRQIETRWPLKPQYIEYPCHEYVQLPADHIDEPLGTPRCMIFFSRRGLDPVTDADNYPDVDLDDCFAANRIRPLIIGCSYQYAGLPHQSTSCPEAIDTNSHDRMSKVMRATPTRSPTTTSCT